MYIYIIPIAKWVTLKGEVKIFYLNCKGNNSIDLQLSIEDSLII